ncbi:MAG TPA: DUF2238 domain-containing protein [Thermodesulfobacteriota bacterium]|nr:DUF2238 domain-containing protein [Thermodesulfobacteriota bacterium]
MAEEARTKHLVLLGTFFLGFIWSGVRPHDYLTWSLEVAPAVVAAVILVFTYDSFEFTTLAYFIVWLHAWVLLVGGHYTYAEEPLFNWIRDHYGLSRNYYDRVGHLFQGFVPAIVAREILLRKSPLKKGGWLFFLVVCVCLAASAFYEFIEWWVAVASGTAADAFLATQGDVWDTQWDMFMSFIGTFISQVTLRGAHDRALERLLRGRDES